MSHRSLATVLVLSSALYACGSASTNSAVDVAPQDGMARPDPALLSRTTAAPATIDAAPSPNTNTGWSLFASTNPMMRAGAPKGLPIGSKCGSDENKVGEFADTCGTKGRIAVEFDPSQTIMTPDPPCQLVTFVHKQKQNDPVPMGGMSNSACVTGEELLASGACQMCRVPFVGWSFHGRIDEMTKAQSVAIFKRLELSGDTPDNAKGWSQLIDKAKVAAVTREGAELASVAPRD